MPRTTASRRQESVARALKLRADANGRPLTAELKDILTSLTPASDRQRLLEALARRRKEMASRAFPGPDSVA